MPRISRLAPVPILLLLAACDSTTPAVSRWEKARVEEGGMTFGLHWSREAERAEAYRVSRHLRPRLSEVKANAAAALRRVTGCAVREGGISGDAALLKVELDCPPA